MKRLKLWAVAAALIMTASCEKPVITDDETSGETETTTATTKKFTFTLKGDFSDQWKPVTRGYLQADGKDLTDVWVLDYMDGKLVQQVHQTDNTAEDFGKPVMSLKYGSHHIYFIASRGQGAQLDTEAKTITFSKVLDTFYKDYEVSVAGSSNGNRAVTLDRVVTRLRLTFTDRHLVLRTGLPLGRSLRAKDLTAHHPDHPLHGQGEDGRTTEPLRLLAGGRVEDRRHHHLEGCRQPDHQQRETHGRTPEGQPHHGIRRSAVR